MNMKKMLGPWNYLLKPKEMMSLNSRQMREEVRGSKQGLGRNALAWGGVRYKLQIRLGA